MNLVYLDPPFNSGRTYSDRAGSFDDRFRSMDAYIQWMRPRIKELHRILKPSGSLYLHCDNHANAYLALLLDEVFGAGQMQSSIKWKRAYAHSSCTRSLPRTCDTILFYGKTNRLVWNTPRDAQGQIFSNMWDDIGPLAATSKERVGWPTQKPVALLERIIAASSNSGHIVLDPFMGAGTTLVAAQRLGRQWIGMDASLQAVAVTARRLEEHCALQRGIDFSMEREPDIARAII